MRRPLRPFWPAVLTEIYLCNACLLSGNIEAQRPRPGYREDDGPAESGEFDRVFVGAVSAMAAPHRHQPASPAPPPAPNAQHLALLEI
eukprot:COSAG01_NODE_9837_length_2327_cov_1.171903_2_plen_88_part_00